VRVVNITVNQYASSLTVPLILSHGCMEAMGSREALTMYCVVENGLITIHGNPFC
jgi:hypothetical protein